MMIVWLFRVLFAASVALAAFLLLAPGDMLAPIPMSLGDVVLHTGLMALVAGLGVLAFVNQAGAIALALVLIGIGTEFGQLYVPGREFHWSDMAANMAGIALGYGAGHITARILGRLVAPHMAGRE